jgi:protein Hikeshi
MAQPLFGIVPTGLPVLTTPTEAPSATSFLYSISSTADRPFSHVVVFLLPGIELPQGTAAAIYLVTAPTAGQTTPSSRFLGGIGPGKESAIFKIGGNPSSATVIGISVEEAGSVATRIEEVRASSSSKALVPSGGPSTLVLAQRIIQNAFNFLASFSSGGGGGGGEVVPLRAFEEWWRKFEGRVRSDPTFLERAQE